MLAEYFYAGGIAPGQYIVVCFDFFVASYQVWRIGPSCYNESNIKYF